MIKMTRKDRKMPTSTRHPARKNFSAILMGFMLFALLIPTARPASAQQFTFNVPVSFSRVVEEATRAVVTCHVCNGQCAGSGNLIGAGVNVINRSEFPNGSLNRTVRVQFNVISGKSAADASHYTCRLAFAQQGSGNRFVRDLGSNPPPDQRHVAAKPGTTFVHPVSGTLN
jgi:hypothetical protein